MKKKEKDYTSLRVDRVIGNLIKTLVRKGYERTMIRVVEKLVVEKNESLKHTKKISIWDTDEN